MKRGVVTALVVYFACSRAHALDPPFGARHQTVITENATASISYSWFDSGASSSFVSLSPSVDYFLLRNFALGLDAGISTQHSQAAGFENDVVSTRLGLRVAPNFAFSRWVSFWPRATAYFDWFQNRLGPAFPPSTTIGPELSLYLPLLLHLRTHFFIGFGPEISHKWEYISGGPSLELTTASMHTMVGGTFGGEKTAAEDDVPIAWRPFGEARELVVGARGSFTWSGTADSGFTFWSTGASVALDYFVVRHFSVGISLDGSYARSEAKGSTPNETGAFSVSPGVGWDVPLGPRFSFYPRAWIGVGTTASTALTTLRVVVTAYAPLLVHAAPHFFLGFGPSITRELVDEDPSRASTSNPGTNVGATLTVGGWL